MIVTRQVLSQYLDLKNISDNKITTALNDSGFEVERVFSFNDLNTNIVIGKIIKTKPHPQSNKLSICLVDINEESLLSIVCGATNVAVNRYVIVAKIGSHLANGMFIEARTILNEPSEGMLCSLSELGLMNIDSQTGIYLFPEDKEYPLNAANPLDFILETDTAFDVTLTYNRSDCLSIYELARELAAYFNISLKPLLTTTEVKNSITVNKEWDAQLLKITFDNDFVQGLASVQLTINNNLMSPQWLISRLLYANIKPTNLVQDLLNYVTWETGQPLIGYDAAKIKGEIIITKNQDLQLENITFDDYVIQSEDLLSVIGVTTNSEFQIDVNTKMIVILSLNLNEAIMRRQQKRNLIIDNNHHLLCWTKPNSGHNLTLAVQRFLDLLGKMSTMTMISSIVKNKSINIIPKVIKTTVKKQKSILGINNLTKNKINKLLQPLGFIINAFKKELQIQIPLQRIEDITNEADISEEIARRYGYNNIVDQQPLFLALPNLQKNWSEVVLTTITNYLLDQNIFEVKTYNLESIIALEQFNFFKMKQPIKVLNPTSIKHEYLRVNLVNALLAVAQYNNLRKNYNLKMYTCENLYDDFKFHHQELTIFLQGNWWSVPYLEKVEKIDFMNVKAILQAILMKLNFQDLEVAYVASQHSKLHPYLQADVFVNEIHIATIGRIHPEVEAGLTLKDDNFIISLNLSQLTNQFKTLIKYQKVSKNMSSWFDFSLLISKNQKYDTIVKPLLKISDKLVDLQLINIYENDNKFGADKKSLTLRLFFNDHNQQFTDEDLKIEYNLFVEAIKKLGVVIR